jgi:hypothetical protein
MRETTITVGKQSVILFGLFELRVTLRRDKTAALWLSHRLVQIALGEQAMADRGTFRDGLARTPIGSRGSSMVPIGV